MKELYKKYKNYVLVGALAVALVFGYFYIFGGEEGPLLSSDTREEQTEVGQELLRLLLQIRSLELDDSIFSRPAFNQLQDFSQELVAEPVGRTNPFAPLGVDPVTPEEPEASEGE
ncbi:MAG: hypothetical protein WDZ90_01450 [Candidatus Paceibacterota bacterium]